MSVTPCYDVVIIGAGAAGCAAALSLPPGTRALMVDRAAPDWERCCGGLLAPDGQAAVAHLGLRLPDRVRVRPEPHRVHVHDLDSGREQTYRRDYVNLDRARFDAWLRESAGQKVEARLGTRFVGLDAEGVRLSGGGREEVVPARLVIGADGAGSSVRGAVFPGRPRPLTMLAMQARLSGARPPEAHEVLFASWLTGFYAWAIPKPEEVLVGCAFDRPGDARGRFRRVLEWYREVLGLGGDVVGMSARRLSRPRARRELFAGTERVLLVGEAAGLVSPSSGEGLSFAMESGAAAGRALGSSSPDRAYQAAFRGLALRVTVKVWKARAISSPSLRRWAMRLPWCP